MTLYEEVILIHYRHHLKHNPFNDAMKLAIADADTAMQGFKTVEGMVLHGATVQVNTKFKGVSVL